ncbi:MAG: methyltransferase domain-containing protein [Gemmataceae bacterium]|nr:methyltransferase domain-containing protein [Gemmataceae bacterium]
MDTLQQFGLLCPQCGSALLQEPKNNSAVCSGCRNPYPIERGVLNLLRDETTSTDEHYTLQWSREKGFLQFLKSQAEVKKIIPGGQMGWNDLFEEIRAKGRTNPSPRVSVYDAACGFGGIASELVQDDTAGGIAYLGADIHRSLGDITQEIPQLALCGQLIRWDIGNPLPAAQKFDYVICRAALHHTPDPRRTFASLCKALKVGGRLAITVYRKKGLARETLDDAFRKAIIPMDTREAFAVSRQFAVLGRALQAIQGEVSIEEDLPLFGIKKGSYPVQTLIYNYFLKCFWNPVFGEEYSTLVNYDWYHPPFAYRYEPEEILGWYREEGLEVVKRDGIEAQYYFLGEKKA